MLACGRILCLYVCMYICMWVVFVCLPVCLFYMWHMCICICQRLCVYACVFVYLCDFMQGGGGRLITTKRFGRKHQCVWIPRYMLTLYSIQCTSYPSSNIEESDKFLITLAVYWISILIQEHVSEWSDMTDHQRWIWWKVPLRCQATERMICPFIQS